MPARQLETRTILVTLPVDESAPTAAIYVHVSSPHHRGALDRQIARLTVWSGRHGNTVTRTETDVGSWLTGRRRRLMRLTAFCAHSGSARLDRGRDHRGGTDRPDRPEGLGDARVTSP